MTETLEEWIHDLVPPKRAVSNNVDLIKGRVSYARKGNNLTLNLKKIDDALMTDILEFLESKID